MRSRFRIALWCGCLFWVIFAIFAVWLRGVRWDEDYEFAQAMTGAVSYPEGHPLVLYTRGAYNLQFYSSAALLLVNDDPAFLNSIRNFLFVVATVLPVFLAGSLLAGTTLAGYVAVVLVLAGVHLEFDGTYPQFVWPGMFSNGHIGMGFALLFVCAAAARRPATTGTLLGLMPAVHMGQMPPVLLFSAWKVAALWRDRNRRALVHAGIGLAVGVAVSLAFLVVQRQFAVSPPENGPYVSSERSAPIWRGHVAFHDMHRQIPVGNSHFVPIALMLIGVAGYRAQKRLARPETLHAWKCFLVFSAAVIAVVYGIVAVHSIFGVRTPYVFLGWLPYRLANHLPLILACICVALLLGCKSDSLRYKSAWIVTVVFGFLLLRPLLQSFMDSGTAQRYLSTTDSMFFFLWGASLSVALLAIRDDVRFVTVWTVLSAAALLTLAWFHQFGAACVLLGAATGYAAYAGWSIWPTARRRSFPTYARATALLLATCLFVAILVQEYRMRSQLRVGEFEAAVAEYVAEENPENAPLVAQPDQLLLQAQTDLPVLVDMATRYHASYMPRLAPAIQTVYLDLYGLDFRQPPGSQPPWQKVWAGRSREEWAVLGEKYGFRYVIAPRDVGVRLKPVLEGEHDVLYDTERPTAAAVKDVEYDQTRRTTRKVVP